MKQKRRKIIEKNELVTKVAEKSGMKENEVIKILDAFTGTIKDGLAKGEKVPIAGFGTFSLSHRKAQTFLNPKTQQIHEIPERSLPHFKASPEMDGKLQDKNINEYE